MSFPLCPPPIAFRLRRFSVISKAVKCLFKGFLVFKLFLFYWLNISEINFLHMIHSEYIKIFLNPRANLAHVICEYTIPFPDLGCFLYPELVLLYTNVKDVRLRLFLVK